MTTKQLIEILKTMPENSCVYFHLPDYTWSDGRVNIYEVIKEDNEVILTSAMRYPEDN